MSPDKHRIESARTRIILTGLVSLASTTGAWSAEPPRLGKAPVKQVTAALSLEEKAALVVGEGMWLPPMFNPDGTEMKFPENSPLAHQPRSESFKLVLGAAGTTYAVPRLGIGTSVLCDGPAGLRISATRPGESDAAFRNDVD